MANTAAASEIKVSKFPNQGSNCTKGDATNGTNRDSDKAPDKEPVAGSSKSSSEKDLDVMTQAMGHFATGKRDLLNHGMQVLNFIEACIYLTYPVMF